MVSRVQLDGQLKVLQRCKEIAESSKAPLDAVMDAYMAAIADIMPPLPPQGSDIETLNQAYDKLGEYLANVEPGGALGPITELMINTGLDPKNATDRRSFNSFLRSNAFIEKVPATRMHYVKRIANGGTTGSAANGNGKRRT